MERNNHWERVDDESTKRLRIRGGWLVKNWGAAHGGITFVPDPKHQWKLEEKME